MTSKISLNVARVFIQKLAEKLKYAEEICKYRKFRR